MIPGAFASTLRLYPLMHGPLQAAKQPKDNRWFECYFSTFPKEERSMLNDFPPSQQCLLNHVRSQTIRCFITFRLPFKHVQLSTFGARSL